MIAKEDFVLMGRIVQAHGLNGGVRVLSFFENPEDIFTASVFDEMGKKYVLSRVGNPIKKNLFYAALEGVSRREEAEVLKGTDLYIQREAVSGLNENTFLSQDLIGLEAVDLSKKAVGIVISVQNYGAGDILEIKDSLDKKRLMPFQKEAVIEVDRKGHKIVIDPAYLL